MPSSGWDRAVSYQERELEYTGQAWDDRALTSFVGISRKNGIVHREYGNILQIGTYGNISLNLVWYGPVNVNHNPLPLQGVIS